MLFETGDKIPDGSRLVKVTYVGHGSSFGKLKIAGREEYWMTGLDHEFIQGANIARDQAATHMCAYDSKAIECATAF